MLLYSSRQRHMQCGLLGGGQVQIVVLVLTTVQTIVILATVIVAWISLKKFRDSQGVNFLIEAEGKIDPLIHQLVGADSDLIRSVYSTFDLSNLSDTECRAFPVMQSLYIQVSRLYHILTSRSLDLGLTESQRVELIREWTSYLSLYKTHPAMIKMHQHAMTVRDFNEEFLDFASNLMSVNEIGKGSSPQLGRRGAAIRQAVRWLTERR